MGLEWHKIAPNRFKTTYRSVLTFEVAVYYLFKTFRTSIRL